MEPLLELDGLTKAFGPNPVLRSVALSVNRGEILGFVGPNGAGKSTTLRILVGVLSRDAGRVRVFEHDPATSSLAIRRRATYLPGETSLYGHLRGGEFLEFALHFYPDLDDALRIRLMADWPLPWSQRVRHYSAGMKQKLALMACLIPDVELYVLDEPDRALDANARLLLRQLLRDLRDRGKSVLLSSHHLAEVEAVANRMVFLLDGETIAEERVEAARQQLSRQVRLRLARPDVELPPGYSSCHEEADGSLRVQTETAPMAWLRQLPADAVTTAEVGVVRLEELYRALGMTEEVGR